ncbi:MAG: ribonuclease P protein component [Oscillospiraceae bacterium]
MVFTVSLTDNKDFLRLYKKGTAVFSRHFTLYFLQNRLPFNRLGITTGKKTGNAVRRNRIRRIIKAAYSENELKFPVGFDIAIVAKASAGELKTAEVSKSVIFKAVKIMESLDSKNNDGFKKRS